MKAIGAGRGLVLGAMGLGAVGMAALGGAPEYPEARRVDHVDVYHGVEVADPYRWLEDQESEEVQAWARAQDGLAREMLDSSAQRASILERLDELAAMQRPAAPSQYGERFFYTRRMPDQKQGVYYVREGLEGTPRALVDPNPLTRDGSKGLQAPVPSDNGRYLFYSVGNGIWYETARVMDVETGEDLPERFDGLTRLRTVLGWMPDESGFFYSRVDGAKSAGGDRQKALENLRLLHHEIGTPVSADRVIFEADGSINQLIRQARVTFDGGHLVFTVSSTDIAKRSVHVVDLSIEGWDAREIVPDGLANFSFEGGGSGKIWLMTNLEAPRNRIIEVDLAKPARAHWRDLVPQGKAQLTGASEVGEHLMCSWQEMAAFHATLHGRDGTLIERLEIPGTVSVLGLPGDLANPESVFIFAANIGDPGTVHRYDLASRELRVHERTEGMDWDPDEFVVERVSVTSADGTEVPMFLCRHRDTKPDPETPTFMVGYGAFGAIGPPGFGPRNLLWMESGGVVAMPKIRGGGINGPSWYEAGKGVNKPRGIEDFIAGGEWLIANGYTSKAKLVANGGSAGGPIAAGAIAHRPDLFGAAIIDYPAIDLLRAAETIRRTWLSEFGDASDPEQFESVLESASYQRIEEGTCYPAVFISAGDQDESTRPLHAYKFTAALQHAQSCDSPIVLRMGWGDGHYPRGTANTNAWMADRFAFLAEVMGIRMVR